MDGFLGDPDAIVTLSQLAEILGLSWGTTKDLLKEANVPPIRSNKKQQQFYRLGDVEERLIALGYLKFSLFKVRRRCEIEEVTIAGINAWDCMERCIEDFLSSDIYECEDLTTGEVRKFRLSRNFLSPYEEKEVNGSAGT